MDSRIISDIPVLLRKIEFEGIDFISSTVHPDSTRLIFGLQGKILACFQCGSSPVFLPATPGSMGFSMSQAFQTWFERIAEILAMLPLKIFLD